MNLFVNNISIRLGNTDIVKNVSLKVKDSQTVGIIGPNGCGKSTLLKSIYKVIHPKAGNITLDDLDVLAENEKTIAKNIAVVGQFNELSFDFSVYDMVIMGRAPHKHFMEADTEEDIKLVNEALAKVNLFELKNHSYLSLSGGEKQRVILARAMVQQPRLLVLDEPTNHLDIKYQLQVLNLVKDMNTTTLAVLHDLELAAKYCNYLYAMKNGEIVASGTPAEVLTKEKIKMIYEVDCEIYENPITKALSIAYLDAAING
ncbi:ABC transporter ATP-binding protein [Konateibacter massiliensis]|uniref:ABC transporter ATP-binding protein n=1 Tax=Konateibacter massiliensis TaxID=2002841 RepID=UPI000C14647A|nr:ABC transporter ATP-binding protein [Konateibacter massiliensis]